MAGRNFLMLRAPLPNYLHFSPKRSCSTRNLATVSCLQPPDVASLAETSRINLTPKEVEEFGLKIHKVVDWFGQVQEVDLNSVEPFLRGDTEVNRYRDDIPELFENRDAMISAVPTYEEPYIKVPKVLKKE